MATKTKMAEEFTLTVTDPESVTELTTKGEEYGLRALKIGLLALRTAAGALDAEALRQEGERVTEAMRGVVSEHARIVAQSLSDYFDPRSGKVQERLDNLLAQKGNDLAIVLGETIETAVKPLQMSLDPAVSGNFVELLSKALNARNEAILKQFSLDDRGSALARFLDESRLSNAGFATEMGDKVKQVMMELSLDDPDSGLSRMRDLIAKATSAVDTKLTLDDPLSPLARLRSELLEQVREIARVQAESNAAVQAAIASMSATRSEAAKSTTHGAVFEEAVVAKLKSNPYSLLVQASGNTTGTIRGCKVGDAIITLPADYEAAGARIVVEAKESAAYDLQKALDECEVAKKNRDAQVAVFIWSAKSSPSDLRVLTRDGNNIIVVWDAEDPTSFGNQVFDAALSLAVGLCTRVSKAATSSAKSLQKLDNAIVKADRVVKRLDDIKTYAGTAQSAATKILAEVEKGYGELVESANAAREASLELRSSS